MFGAAGMGEAGAGVGVAARRAHVRLCATGGPPAVRVFFGLTHFYAASSDFGFGTVAVTAARGDAPQEGRRIGEKRQRASEKAKGRPKQAEGKLAGQECSVAKASHAPFCASFLKKTDSAESLRVLLPGFWDLILRGSSRSSRLAIRNYPNGVESQSGFRFEFDVRIWGTSLSNRPRLTPT